MHKAFKKIKKLKSPLTVQIHVLLSMKNKYIFFPKLAEIKLLQCKKQKSENHIIFHNYNLTRYISKYTKNFDFDPKLNFLVSMQGELQPIHQDLKFENTHTRKNFS